MEFLEFWAPDRPRSDPEPLRGGTRPVGGAARAQSGCRSGPAGRGHDHHPSVARSAAFPDV